MISPPIIRVDTPQDVCQTYSRWHVEGPGEILTEFVAGAHLQRLAVTHHRLAGQGVGGTREAFPSGLASLDDRDC
jgi:hypothetical protein